MLKASAGFVDMTPPPNSWLTGFAARIEPATDQHDPITARALVIKDAHGSAVAIAACDLVGISTATAQHFQQRVAQRTQIPTSHILIACTHTHSGPASLHFRGTMGHVDEAWLAGAMDKAVELVVHLAGSLRPAKLAHACRTVPGIGHNRQDALHPIDEGLQVVAIDDLSDSPIATLLNYSMHPVILGPGNQRISAEYPGEACRVVEAARGGIALFLQGACGDVNPSPNRDKGPLAGGFDDTQAIGKILGNAAVEALSGATPQANGTIQALTECVDIPLAPPPSATQIEEDIARMETERLEQAAQGNRRQELGTRAMIDWARELLEAVKQDRVPSHVTAQIFAAAVGELRIVGVPFEPYSDIALRIKKLLQPHPVVFCGYANGVIGYLPTGKALEQGGYGPATSHRWYRLLTPITYGADDLVVEKATCLAEKLVAS